MPGQLRLILQRELSRLRWAEGELSRRRIADVKEPHGKPVCLLAPLFGRFSARKVVGLLQNAKPSSSLITSVSRRVRTMNGTLILDSIVASAGGRSGSI